MTEKCNETAWPAIIFVIIIIIILAGIALSSSISSDIRALTFIIILVLGTIWGLIIYWFCHLGYHTIGWFMLILPIFIYLAWIASYWMASVTTQNQCIIGGFDDVWPKMLKFIGVSNK